MNQIIHTTDSLPRYLEAVYLYVHTFNTKIIDTSDLRYIYGQYTHRLTKAAPITGTKAYSSDKTNINNILEDDESLCDELYDAFLLSDFKAISALSKMGNVNKVIYSSDSSPIVSAINLLLSEGIVESAQFSLSGNKNPNSKGFLVTASGMPIKNNYEQITINEILVPSVAIISKKIKGWTLYGLLPRVAQEKLMLDVFAILKEVKR